jgi:hypothetical protein
MGSSFRAEGNAKTLKADRTPPYRRTQEELSQRVFAVEQLLPLKD